MIGPVGAIGSADRTGRDEVFLFYYIRCAGRRADPCSCGSGYDAHRLGRLERGSGVSRSRRRLGEKTSEYKANITLLRTDTILIAHGASPSHPEVIEANPSLFKNAWRHAAGLPPL